MKVNIVILTALICLFHLNVFGQKKDTLSIPGMIKKHKKSNETTIFLSDIVLAGDSGINVEEYVASVQRRVILNNVTVLNRFVPHEERSDMINQYVEWENRAALYINSSIIKGCIGNLYGDNATISIQKSQIECVEQEGRSFYKPRQENRTTLEEDTIGSISRRRLGGSLSISDCTFRSGCFSFSSHDNFYTGFKTEGNEFKSMELKFSNDSIMRFEMPDLQNLSPLIRRHKKEPDILFNNSFIDTWLNLPFADSFRTRIEFIDVTFGENAELSGIKADTIVFKGCTFLKPLRLDMENSGKVCALAFRDTDVTKLKIEFAGRFTLFDEPGVEGEEALAANYANILAELKRLGKMSSYRNLDIAYQDFKYGRDGYVYKVVGYAHRVWWNYGYNKEWVFGWILSFLAFFSIINLIWWKQVQKTYEVPELIARRRIAYNAADGRKAISVLLYTLFLFFSISIKFERLHYHKTRWMLFVLAQYFVGLVCLFFLVNAILKF